jgi:GNAT superfamily N-acetyltransferase
LKRCKQAAPASCGGIVGQVSITMRPMQGDEFEQWLPRMRDDYAEDMRRNAGASKEAAREKAAADVDRLFPDGRPSPDQSVFVIEADGQPVGELWATERQEDVHRGALWVFDVRIDEMHRGRGYGKAAMLLAEGEARRRGLSRVALNVFGGNEVARNLYRSLGYQETAVTMRKTL